MGHSRRLLNSHQVVRLSDVTVSVANAHREYGANLFYRFNVSDRIPGCVRGPARNRRNRKDNRQLSDCLLVQRHWALRFFEIAFVFVRFDHVASVIVNANHGIMRPAVEFGVVDCIAEFVWLVIPQPTKWQRIGDKIKAASIFARANLVNVFNLFHAFVAKGN
jgi:hypothetical protein